MCVNIYKHNIINNKKVNMKEKFLLILFYSASGSVRNLAHAIADGAEEYDLKVKLRTVPKISKGVPNIKLPIN